MVDRGLVGRPIVVGSLFKACWNAVYSRPLTDGFTRIELQGYWGWLAVSTASIATDMRDRALEAYASAGGPRIEQLRGALAFMASKGSLAHAHYLRAFELTGNTRMLNHALAAEGLLGLE